MEARTVIPGAPSGLPERYVVQRLLGEGGFGRVYLATDRHLRRECAIKVATQPDGHERLEREARIAASFGSSHVVRVFDVAHLDNGAPYLVMEYLRGESLSSYLAREGKLDPRLVAEWARQICSGLAEAHTSGLIHRDLKPSNIFLVEEPHRAPIVKLLDFGLARSSTSRVSGATLTTSGITLGSPAYMSPEQIRDVPLEASTDIWSLGVVMYRMLAGQLPFNGSSNGAILAAIAADPHEPIESHVPELSVQLVGIIDRCLAKVASQRFQSAVELAEALRLLDFAPAVGSSAPPPELSTHPASSEPTEDITAIAGDPVTPWRPATKRSVVLGVALGAVALATTAALLGILPRRIDEPSPIRTASAPIPQETPRSSHDDDSVYGAASVSSAASSAPSVAPSPSAVASSTPKASLSKPRAARPASGAPSETLPAPAPPHAAPRIIEEPAY